MGCGFGVEKTEAGAPGSGEKAGLPWGTQAQEHLWRLRALWNRGKGVWGGQAQLFSLCLSSPSRDLLRSQEGEMFISGGPWNLKEATLGLEQTGDYKEMAKVSQA